VVPDVAAIARRFDYLVPPSLAPDVAVGSRVRVDLHGRRVGAWVVELDVAPTEGVEPKAIAASSGFGPPAPVVELAEWASWRWAGPLPAFLGSASPPRVVRQLPAARAHREDRLEAPGSPGGGAVELVEAALAAPGPAVLRLAPALDANLVVLQTLHRVGTSGVLVLAPSRRRAEQVAARVGAAGCPVALLPDGWPSAASGGVVAVGTRAAAWAPLPRLSAAVVLDAHDESYREQRAPTWSAVDVVLERARRESAAALLVSACPTVVMSEDATVVTTPRALERRGWPTVEVLDRTGDDPRTGLYSHRLVAAARSVLARPEGRVVCVLNRTGRVRILACADCGALARCEVCGGAVAQAERGGPLVCGRCGASRPPLCAVCDSARLKVVRMGVSRAAEELGALLGAAAVEVTSERSPGDPDAGLVVGTEAALHRVSRADLVAFLDIDQHLLAPRFVAGEQTLGLLARAARLVGGRDGDGRLLVQTRLPDHEVLRAAAQADPALLGDHERALRRTLGLPPFGALAALRGPGAAVYAEELARRAGLSVAAGTSDRWVVRAGDHRVLCDALGAEARPAERLRVEVDPVDV
jgi:primosomal protein N' (replication factor Y) (superfamily II helicase)